MVNDNLTTKNHTLTAKNRTARTRTAQAGTAAALALSALALAGLAHADGHTMPDVTGRGLVDAFQTLDYDTGIRFRDGRGAGRHVLWPASWKVCGQQPAPGTPLKGRQITLTVVKDEERCAPGAG
ncbi:PASTA domain-containing protein [Streptomyces sp. NPDC059008]|uniref:PASTA domain-containing protein n=1 Tax=Streptomyces sp. NPDC059008 TaxID=3346693 RepID=UPI00369B0A74